MPSTYTGSEEYTEALTKPSDGDGPHIKAGDVNPAFDDLKNGVTFAIYRSMCERATNWPYIGDVNADCQMAVFSVKEQAWYVIGFTTVKEVARHFDNGNSLGGVNYELSGGVSSQDLLAIASNPNGDLVVIAKTDTTYKHTWASYGGAMIFTGTATALSATPSGGDVCFEATAGKYVVVYRNGILGMKTENSSNGTVWTSHAPPAAWTGYTGTNNPVVAAIPGRTIAAFIDGGAVKVNIIRSTDGGATWSTNVQFTPSFTPTIISKPVYSAFYDEWYILLGAANHTEIIMSENGGLTWTSVYTITVTGNDLACDGQQLILIAADGRIAHSLDHGAHFDFVTRYTYATPASRFRIFTGGGGFFAINDAEGNSRATVRMGTWAGRQAL